MEPLRIINLLLLRLCYRDHLNALRALQWLKAVCHTHLTKQSQGGALRQEEKPPSVVPLVLGHIQGWKKKNEQFEEGSVKPVSMDHGTGKVGGYGPIPGQQKLNIRVCRGMWEPWYSWGDVQPCCEPFPLAATVSGLKDPGFIEERDALHSLSQPRESTRRCQCMVLRVFRRENAVSTDLSYR